MLSKIKWEILKNMVNLQIKDQSAIVGFFDDCLTENKKQIEISADFIFKPDFLGFSGHFPQQSILPGVCEILSAISIVESALNTKISLKEIILAKFLAPILPNEKIIVNCKCENNNGKILILVLIEDENKVKKASLKLEVEKIIKKKL